MVQVDADILLIDEVLAVGDVAFQQKCFDVFNRLRDEGKTILFVTHDMAAVQPLLPPGAAARARRGACGSASRTTWRRPTWTSASRPASEGPVEEAAERGGDGAAELIEAWWEDEHGERR